MACAIIPQVLNKEGKKVDSRLFKDLLSFLFNNREKTVETYQKVKNKNFAKDSTIQLALDENGEPTIYSMLQNTTLKYDISEPMILERLNRDIGHYIERSDKPKLVSKNDENYEKLASKARDFNFNSDFRDGFIAMVNTVVDSSNKVYYNLKVEKKTKDNVLDYRKQEYNVSLNNKLRGILSSHGVSIGVLTELERRMGINGVTDFDLAKTAAEGTIELIRLAEGIKGEQALPEEFAHFALEALGSDNPLATRLINLIASNGLAKEIIGEDYEEYSRLYNKDEAKLAKEAAGKLLAKHLLQAEEIPTKPYKNLLQRVISSIKNFFRNMSASSIQKAMWQADKSFGALANDILSGNLDDQINIKNISETNSFFNVSERVKRDDKILQDIIDTELKRYKIYEKRGSDTFTEKQQERINILEQNLKQNMAIEGIYNFTNGALNTLKLLSTRLVSVMNSPGSTPNDKAKILRDIRNYIYSYKGIINEIRKALIEEKEFDDNRYGDRIESILNEVSLLLNDLKIQYDNASVPIFTEFIKPFLPKEGLTVPFGKKGGREITAESIVSSADEDISFFDRWLDSMADSSSYQLKVIDQAVKNSKGAARAQTIRDMKEIQAAGVRLEQAGIKGTDWMFEKDSNGNLTGRYIQEINYGLYKEAKKAEADRLAKKYGENPTGDALNAYNAEWFTWFKNNLEDTGQPKKSIYGNKDFENLSDAQKAFYNTVMDIKSRLDALLPEGKTSLYNTIKIRKDLIERVKSSGDVKSGLKQIWESLKDQVLRRSDDIELGDRTTIKDFEGREVQTLPIYYTQLKEGESNNDVSTDVVSTLIAYAAMANDFNEMNKIVDVLELGRDILKDPELFKINKTRGGKPLVEKFTALGRKVESIVTKESGEKRLIDRLDDAFSMQVYGRYMEDEGTFGNTKIDKAKGANLINRATSINTLALNILSGISNVATGKVMMRIEAFAKEFFSESDVLTADRNYGKSLPAFLAELNSRVKISKLSLWGEKFDVMQDYEQSVREKQFNRSWFARIFGGNALFIMNNAGEHWMQHRTSLALANAYKMKAPNGKLVSLWDAMEVVYLDPNNKALGATLEVKKGYTKLDGSEFTQEDIIKFSKKSAAINQRMHGIYNKLDRSAIQKLALGRMAIMFRKWIKPSLNRRFKSAGYNFDLEAWTEGYYRTTGRFLIQVAKELRQGQLHLIANYKSLSDTEKANIRRAMTEVGHYAVIVAALALIDWDGKDRPWLKKMTEYQLRRLKSEIGILIPGKPMLDEGLKIIKSPAAAIQTIQSTLDLVGLINPWNYGEDAILKSGQFKGHTKAYRLLMKSPLAPMRNTLTRGGDPDLAIPFFK